ncbi:MAG: hypothetical protein COA43_09365 [Robiginitomaculum sp.]|nr:MAG: hypothetical protein COA43_09365 [Robiginitomaculum sp.]
MDHKAPTPVHMEMRDRVGEKLFSPSAERNRSVIGKHLVGVLPKNAHVLEIASGTGQHAAHVCGLRKDIKWQMSDIDAPSRQSQNAYAQDLPRQLPLSLTLDVTREKWWQDLGNTDVIYCANMIHIAPWDAALGLAKGGSIILQNGGVLCLYGPFLTGETTASSNLAFDRSLKARNSHWGVRNLDSVKHIFADRGLNSCTVMDMPQNNLFLIFKTKI